MNFGIDFILLTNLLKCIDRNRNIYKEASLFISYYALENVRDKMKQQVFVELNGTPTKVITWGKHLHDQFLENEELIVCVPGNPGVTQFYETFLTTLYKNINKPIWIIGHSGHEKQHDDNINNFNFTLEGQINQKKVFIEKFVPSHVKIHLLGHSVGTYSILKLLQEVTIKEKVIKSYFMFPTIEHVAKSKNGKFMLRIIHPIIPIILFFSWVFTILPRIVQVFLIHIYLFVTGVEKDHLEAIIKFVDPFVLQNIFIMAYDQINTVKERPDDELMKHSHLLKCYYAEKDNWVPKKSPYNLMKSLPELDVEVSRDAEHSFVLWQSKKMGEVVSEWLRN